MKREVMGWDRRPYLEAVDYDFNDPSGRFYVPEENVRVSGGGRYPDAGDEVFLFTREEDGDEIDSFGIVVRVTSVTKAERTPGLLRYQTDLRERGKRLDRDPA